MIGVVWKDPNFISEIEDANGVIVEEIRWAESKAEIEEQLQARVKSGAIRAVRSVESYDFADWVKRAEQATEDAVNGHVPGKPYKFNSAIWRELKSYLVHLFRGKCAYCEARFVEVAFGDVEHYRPKAKVTDLDGKTILVGGKPHPGYYWLAYNYRNLMPACQLCNQAFGKMNRFPLAPGSKRGCKPPNSEVGEDPMLLCPYESDFSARTHLEFITKKKGIPLPGIVRARSPRGEASIAAYRLNRPPLIDARAEAQIGFLGKLLYIIHSRTSLREEKLQYAAGVRPFSAAVLTEIEDFEADLGISIPI